MKFRSISLSAIFILVVSSISAQKSYISIHAGYGDAFGSQNLSGFSNYTEIATQYSSSLTADQIDLSLGKGTVFGATAGYMYNSNIGAELALSLLKGDIISSKSTSSNGSDITNSSQEISAEMIRFNPSVVFFSGLETINPYLKVGILFGSGDITFKTAENEGTHSKGKTYLLNGGWGIGATANVGVQYKIDNKISCFCELAMVNMSYAPTNGEITANVENGINLLPSMTTFDKKVEFKESITKTSQATSTSIPDVQLSNRFPFGSLGINIGLKYNLQ